MENCSHDGSSFSGSSGSVGVPAGHKPKFQPIRIKKLLETMSSDDESEDRERVSDEESDVSEILDDNKSKNADPIVKVASELPANKNDKAITNLAALNLDAETSKRSSPRSPDLVPKIIQTESAPVAPPLNTTNQTHFGDETPLKQIQAAGSSRPTPCFSQKNLFMTPQNRIEADYQRNYVPTPATIFSHWSQNRLHTPLQNQAQWSKEAQSTGKSAIQSSSSKQELQRYYHVENKNVRRPLAETMKSNLHPKETVPPFCLDTKPSVQQQHRPTPKIEVPYKPIVVEGNRELKENKSPNANEFLNTDIPPKSYQVPSEDHIIARVMPHQFSSQVKQEIVGEVKDVPKVISTISSKNDHPKAVNRVPIASVPMVQTNQEDEFLRVKNKRYRNLGLIGRGMSGKVYRVQNLADNQLLAIKYVDFTKLEKEGVQGCLEEIRMLHKLQAPCVIRMFDYEVRDNCAYVVMELGDTDLSNLIKTNSVETDLYFTLYYWRQMLIAVNHIHKHGVIHSDLKPGNFVLVKGLLKLIDFGIASNLSGDMTSVVKNSTTGTLNYISPESITDVGDSPSQTAKHKINYKSDVWSLGCILYSLVYGRTPFQDIRSQWQKMSAIQNPKHKIPFPTNSGHKLEIVPPVLIDVMKRCLNRDKNARPTVQQLLDVSYISTNQSISPEPISEIPAHIMAKIKQNRLTDEEWREFVQLMERRRQP